MPTIGAPEPRVFDIRRFGAKVDGRTIYDGSTTSGSTTFRSPGEAGWTSADIGRTVVVRGAGTGGAELVATITALAPGGDTSAVTLSSPAASTGSSLLTTIATDDTTAVRAALAACVAADGGTVYHPGGICLLTGAPQTGTASGQNYAGVLTIPPRLRDEGQNLIRFKGANAVPMMFYGVYTSQRIGAEAGCSVYQFTCTSGFGVDVIPNSTLDNLGNHFSSWQVVSEDMMWRFPNNPQCGGLNFRFTNDASLRRSAIVVHATANTLANPLGSTTACVALTLPPGNNNGHTYARDTNIYGFPTGIVHSEHTILDNVYITYAQICIVPEVAAHLSWWPAVYLAQYKVGVAPTGNCYIKGSLSLEPGTVGPALSFQCDVDDWLLRLKGQIDYHTNASGPRPLVVNGATQVEFMNLGNPAVSSQRPSGTSTDFTNGATSRTARGALPLLDSGQSWSTVGPGTWSGGTGTTAGVTCPSGGYAMTLSQNGTNPTVTAVITTDDTATSAGVVLLGTRAADVQFNVLLTGGNTVQINKGATQVATGTFAYNPSTTYTLAVDYGVTTAGTITAKVNGTTVATYALTPPEQTTYVGQKWVGLRTGTGDAGSAFRSFAAV